ncbi:hypothetical protein AB1Y20_016003 [Prymnesium parvum]|uniref:Chromo domain-containing protein n=1 Tax=Prymnesium parvum TaxID=97485 RepID=A0AB34K2C0_PRYPA
MAPISLSKPLRTVAPMVKFQDETFKRPRVQAVPNDMLRFPNKAWWKVRRLKDLKVQNGARFWLVGWDGSDSGGQPWPDSWEPTANVSKDLIDDFLINRREEVSSRIPVDIRPLRTLVQRSVAAAVMKDKNSAFGRVHEINLDALSLRDLALYYIHSIGEQYQVPIKEQYNPKDKITIVEVRLKDPTQIGDFCSFENFLPTNVGKKSLRFKMGRKSNADAAIVAVIMLRCFDNKRVPGCVTFQVEFHTCHINGTFGTFTTPHLSKGLLKDKAFLDGVVGYARAQMPHSHPLMQKGWGELPSHVHSLPINVAIPDA